jgi:hypothetical protein
MNKELTTQAMTMFDSFDKWSAYLELASQKEAMKSAWFNKLNTVLLRKFLVEDAVPGWTCHQTNNIDFHIYLTEFKAYPIFLCIGWYYKLQLMVLSDKLDGNLVSELLQTEKYSPLLAGFSRIDGINDRERKVIESRNYTFGSPYDGNFSDSIGIDSLSWFAGNRTEEMAEQVMERVNRFRKSEELTALLRELNYQVIKDKAVHYSVN